MRIDGFPRGTGSVGVNCPQRADLARGIERARPRSRPPNRVMWASGNHAVVRVVSVDIG